MRILWTLPHVDWFLPMKDTHFYKWLSDNRASVPVHNIRETRSAYLKSLGYDRKLHGLSDSDLTFLGMVHQYWWDRTFVKPVKGAPELYVVQ